MSTLTLSMTSPKSLKRSFDDANLDNLSPHPPVPQENDEGPSAMLTTKMPADQGDDPTPSVDSSRLSSPGPSHASSSVLKDPITQIPQQPKASAPTLKKPKLTFAEKEARRVEKEVKDRERVEEKARKEHEKETRDRQKVEEKAKKEEEKRAKDFEKDTKRLIQEEKNKVKEEEKRKRNEEKARKEEEKNKKANSQLRLNAFFALPSLPNDGSRESPNRDGQSPSSSRRSSIASLHGSGRERSTSTTPKKAQTPDYERLFPSFFVKAHTRMALWNRFSATEEGKADKNAKIDRFLGQDGSSSVANTTSALRNEPDLKLLNTHLRRRQPCRGARLPVKEIVARLNGTAVNPIDLTNPASHEAVQNPIERLKAIPTKFLKFAEDVRPPYIGTYTKVLEGRKTTKLSRNPFVRALPLIDYDYDSEAEWEEPEEGEDLDSEGEEEVEEDDGEDMEGFLDDRDADEIKKRRLIIGDLEPTYNPTLPIDPYSTSYWQSLSSIAKHEASPSRMDPPRIPLNAVNRLNLQLPNSLPPDSAKPKPIPPSIPTPAKAAKQAQVKRFVAPEVLEAFKAAVQGSDLTKLGLVEILKKQFPKQSKSAIQDTLALVAERTGGKESEKRWVIKEKTWRPK